MKASLLLLPLLTGAVLAQGPLAPSQTADPATGPQPALSGANNPQPTMKTLHQVEPRIPIGPATTPGDAVSVYRITQAGSYYLTQGLTGASGKTGILISADNVTLDLMGFTLQGVAGSGAGISVTSGNSAIRNGSVTNWGGSGISNNSGSPSLIEDIRVEANLGGGIFSGANSVVRRCGAKQNTGAGIATGNQSKVEACQSLANTGRGIWTLENSIVRDCTATANDATGIDSSGSISGCVVAFGKVAGIRCGTGLVKDCKVAQTTGYAFESTGSVDFEGCKADGNAGSTGSGYHLNGSGRLTRCTAFNFDHGIYVASPSNLLSLILTDCRITQSVSSGINLLRNANFITGSHQIIGCTVEGVSAGVGMYLDYGTTVRDCMIRQTSSDGLRCRPNCTVMNNTFISNGGGSTDGAIYFTSGTDNIKITGNTMISSTGWGVVGGGSGIIITGNTILQPSIGALSVTGANLIGPLVTPANIATNTHPNANFTR